MISVSQAPCAATRRARTYIGVITLRDLNLLVVSSGDTERNKLLIVERDHGLDKLYMALRKLI